MLLLIALGHFVLDNLRSWWGFGGEMLLLCSLSLAEELQQAQMDIHHYFLKPCYCLACLQAAPDPLLSQGITGKAVAHVWPFSPLQFSLAL